MRICLGEEYTKSALDRVSWVREHFDKDCYKIYADGFLINDYYVEFNDEKYETLYLLQYPK